VRERGGAGGHTTVKLGGFPACETAKLKVCLGCIRIGPRSRNQRFHFPLQTRSSVSVDDAHDVSEQFEQVFGLLPVLAALARVAPALAVLLVEFSGAVTQLLRR
jgi:hypothetical protein